MINYKTCMDQNKQFLHDFLTYVINISPSKRLTRNDMCEIITTLNTELADEFYKYTMFLFSKTFMESQNNKKKLKEYKAKLEIYLKDLENLKGTKLGDIINVDKFIENVEKSLSEIDMLLPRKPHVKEISDKIDHYVETSLIPSKREYSRIVDKFDKDLEAFDKVKSILGNEPVKYTVDEDVLKKYNELLDLIPDIKSLRSELQEYNKQLSVKPDENGIREKKILEDKLRDEISKSDKLRLLQDNFNDELYKSKKDFEKQINDLNNTILNKTNFINSLERELNDNMHDFDKRRVEMEIQVKGLEKITRDLENASLNASDKVKKITEDLEKIRRERDELESKAASKNKELEECVKNSNECKGLKTDLYSSKSRVKNLEYELEKVFKQINMLTKEKEELIKSAKKSDNYKNEIQNLEDELKNLNSEKSEDIKDLTYKILDLENQIKQSKKDEENIKKELQSKLQDIKDLNSKLKDKENELKLKNNELIKKDKDDIKIEELQELNNELQSKIKLLSDESKNRLKEIEDLKSKLTEYRNHDEEIQKLKLLDIQSKEYKDEIDKLNKKIRDSETLENQIKSLEDENKTYQEEIEKLKDKTLQLSYKLQESQSQFKSEEDNLKEKLKKCQDDINDTKSKLEDKNKEISDLEIKFKNEDNKDKDYMNKLKDDISDKNKELNDLKTRLSELEEKNTLMFNELKSKEKELNDVSSKISLLDEDENKLRNEVYNLKTELQNAEELNKTLEDKLKYKNIELEKYEQKLSDLKSKLISLDSKDLELDNLKRELEIKKRELIDAVIQIKDKDELEEKISTCNKEIQELNLKIEEKTSKLSDLQDMMNDKSKEIEKLKNDFIMKEKDFDEINESKIGFSLKIESLNEEINKLYENKRIIQDKLDEEYKINSDLQNKIEILEDKIIDLERKNIETVKLREQLLSSEKDNNKEIIRLTDEVLEYKSNLESKNTEISKLRSELEDAKFELKNSDSRKLDIIEKDKLIRENESKIKDLESKILDLDKKLKENEVLKSAANAMKIRSEDLDNINKSLKLKINELENRINENKIQLDDLKEENVFLEKDKKRLEDDSESQQNEYETVIEKLNQKLGESEQSCLDKIDKIVKDSKINPDEIPRDKYKEVCDEKKEIVQEYLNSVNKTKELFKRKIDVILGPPGKLNEKVKDIRKNNLKRLREINEEYGSFIKIIENYVPSQECDNEKISRMSDIEDRSISYFNYYTEISDFYENMKGVGRIYVRVKPYVTGQEYDKSNRVVTLTDDMKIKFNPIDGSSSLFGPFDKIYDENVQTSSLFSEIQPLLENLTIGYNVVFMSYGQSGSGKTYTLLGDNGKIGLFGAVINYLQNNELFSDIKVKSFQLYSDKLYDVLGENPVKLITDENTPFPIGNSTSIDKLSFKNLTSFSSNGNMTNIGEKIVKYIEQRRFQRKTYMNPNSSRSHLFICIDLIVTLPNGSKSKQLSIVFCDLGGNERIREHGTNTKSLVYREGLYIVQTLSDLKQRIIPQYSKGVEIKQSMASGNLFKNTLNYYLQFDSKNKNNKEDIINKLILYVNVHGYYKTRSNLNDSISITTRDTLTFAQELLWG